VALSVMRRLLFALSVFCLGHCQGQIVTLGGAHVNLCFPHLADGGAPSYKFQTSLIFLNGSTTSSAHVYLQFFSDSGGALSLNFGQGPVSAVSLTLAPGGTQTITSTGASATASTGWAFAASDQPVHGTLQFRGIVNGTPSAGGLRSRQFGGCATPSYSYSPIRRPLLLRLKYVRLLSG
jgi:hypothetical protein